MMYYKIIGGREVFSSCNPLKIESEDRWVSNPPEEMILAEGWLPVPPAPPYVPQPELEPDYDQLIQAVKKMLASSTEELSDEDALDVAALFPTWASKLPEDPLTPKPSDKLPVGERLWYDGKLYKVTQAHVPQRDWTPDATPALYTEISIEEIPDWVQPISAETAYHLGDKVKHNGATWESLVDNNVWEPGAVGSEALWREV